MRFERDRRRRSDDPRNSGCREHPVARLPRACPADYNIPDRSRPTVNAGRCDQAGAEIRRPGGEQGISCRTGRSTGLQ